MVNNINIKNFKCFEEINIQKLKQINVIGGINNIGKTTLLEAIFLFFDRTSTDSIIKQFIWRGVTGFSLNVDEVWSPIFSDYDTEKVIEIELDDEKLTLKLNKNYRPVLLKNKDTNLINIESEASIKNNAISALDIEIYNKEKIISRLHQLINNNGLALNLEYMKSTGRQVIINLNKIVNNIEIASRFSKVDEKGMKSEILEILKIIEPKLTDLSINLIGKQSYVFGMLEGLRKIPIAYMGDGINRLLAIITSIAESKNGIVLIDEFENGFHYSILNKIWKMILTLASSNKCQLFITTHSYECLRSLVEGGATYPDEINYIRLDKINNKIISKNFDFKLLSTAIENNWEVR